MGNNELGSWNGKCGTGNWTQHDSEFPVAYFLLPIHPCSLIFYNENQ